jgi:hypothetical protein
MPHPGSDQRRQLARLARERPRAVQAQGGVAGIAHVCLHHRGVDAHSPGRKARLALRLGDHTSRQLLHHVCAEPARELAYCRLVRHTLAQRDQEKRRRCSESDTSRISVSYPQPVRCLTSIRRT